VLATAVGAALLLAACGSGGYSATTTTSRSTASPGTSLHTTSVAGLGSVVVDARGYTVYVLSSGATKNVPCTASSGCIAVWPPLTLPGGTPAATAGAGVQHNLLGRVVISGTSYPTYNGWRLFEFSGDTGPGQSGGQGLMSFGGTWHTLSAAGTPVTATATTSSTTYSRY